MNCEGFQDDSQLPLRLSYYGPIVPYSLLQRLSWAFHHPESVHLQSIPCWIVAWHVSRPTRKGWRIVNFRRGLFMQNHHLQNQKSGLGCGASSSPCRPAAALRCVCIAEVLCSALNFALRNSENSNCILYTLSPDYLKETILRWKILLLIQNFQCKTKTKWWGGFVSKSRTLTHGNAYSCSFWKKLSTSHLIISITLTNTKARSYHYLARSSEKEWCPCYGVRSTDEASQFDICCIFRSIINSGHSKPIQMQIHQSWMGQWAPPAWL